MGRPLPGDLHAEAEEPRALVWMLVLGEALTPRGELGPLARQWLPAPWRRSVRGRPVAGTRGRPDR